ncbi:MAG: RHS repeat-associated core domain-containing protein, partial [Nitrospiraceae bacterium]
MTYKSGTTTIGDLTYTYDAAGNRIKTGGSFARSGLPPALTTVSYNANNQQTTFGTNTETYDLNGNLATVTDAGVTTTYTWNARNQLTGISNTGFSASFTYDSLGRRTGRTVQGTTTNYVYDGVNPVQEKNGGTVTANLITGLGIDEFFQRTDGVGARALLPDALGSTVALGDGTGTLQTQYTYEPFGYATQTGSASTNSYKYTGREDDGSGLDYYRARYYHPRLQRFISEDPIGFDGGDADLYGYVGNNLLGFNDPTGEFFYSWPGAGYGAISGGISGYISSGGTWGGAARGAIAGGFVGFINPFGAYTAGAAAGGFGSSILGQLAGNATTCKNLLDFDYNLAAMSALGGGAGRAIMNYLANPHRNALSHIWSARVGNPSTAFASTVEAYVKGTMSGVAQWFYKSNVYSTPT